MADFIEEILADIDWRVAELATIKSIPIKYSFNNNHKAVYIKYAVPAIYAIWEGFIKSSLTIYLDYLSKLNLKRTEISLNLLTHYVDTTCEFHNPRTSFDSKRKVVVELDSLFVDTINLIPKIPTESNVNYKVLCNLLNRFCIDTIEGAYEKRLDRLLFFRNAISHGENAIKVTVEDISDFIKLIEDLMLDIVIKLQDSDRRKTYKKSIEPIRGGKFV